MLMEAVLERFIAHSPMAVAVRGAFEYALSPTPLDDLFVRTGALSEQTIWLTEPDGAELAGRRVRLTLDAPTRDGDGVIEVLTNLPAEVAVAAAVAELYRDRWSIEGLFLRLTTVLECEVNTPGYPPAALFGFCVALAAGNVYAAVKGVLRASTGRRSRTTTWRWRCRGRVGGCGSRSRSRRGRRSAGGRSGEWPSG